MDGQAGPVEVLAISGAAGVGKTSVAIEVSLQLQRRDVPHALIDTDELDRIHPVPADQAALTEESLSAVWHGFARRGCTRLILAGVWLHRPSELVWIVRAVPGARVSSVMLMAPDATIDERVRRREIGSAAEEQLERSLRHARLMEAEADGVTRLETDGLTVTQVAGRILDLWPGRG